ncbi:MAG: YceH family protein [Pseudomonadales bacterium]|nr:YceH family protein [Pseudomonadales bacterium]
MDIQLNPEEARIIGCLMEKAVTTPDQYPLTLNALTNACNQKSSREPVMHLHQGDVQRTARILKDKHLLGIEEGAKSNVEKYNQRLCNTLLGDCQFEPAEYALVCLLLLRGAQTPGELKSRSGRLFKFDHNQQVVDALNVLMERQGGAIVARLTKRAGRMDHEYSHLFFGEITSVAEDAVTTEQRQSVTGREQQIQTLEMRVDKLEKALGKLAEQLGEEIDLL